MAHLLPPVLHAVHALHAARVVPTLFTLMAAGLLTARRAPRLRPAFRARRDAWRARWSGGGAPPATRGMGGLERAWGAPEMTTTPDGARTGGTWNSGILSGERGAATLGALGVERRLAPTRTVAAEARVALHWRERARR